MTDDERAELLLLLGYRLPMDSGIDAPAAHNEWLKAATARLHNDAVVFNAQFGFGRDVIGTADANFVSNGSVVIRQVRIFARVKQKRARAERIYDARHARVDVDVARIHIEIHEVAALVGEVGQRIIEKGGELIIANLEAPDSIIVFRPTDLHIEGGD